MISFDLKIGFECNNNCRHCVVAGKRHTESYTLAQLKNIIDNVNADSITITGGEPSICDYLLDVLVYCKQKGLKTVIQTNATGFDNLEFCKSCAPYIDHAHVAIHSCYPEVHDNIVRHQGMWERTMNGFKNLIKCKVHVTTQTVVTKYNILTVYDTFAMIQKIKPGIQMSFTYPHMMGNAYKDRKDVCFRYSDYKDEMQRIFKKFQKHLFLESIPPCYIYPVGITNTAENSVLNHKSDRIGVDRSLSEKDTIDYDYEEMFNKAKAPRCKDCVFNSRCLGVWKEYIETFRDCLDLYPITEERL